MEKPIIDPIILSSVPPPSPRAASRPQPRQKTVRVKHRGNGHVDGVLLYRSSGLQPKAMLPAFNHIHSTLVAHRHVANGLMASMSVFIAACALFVVWYPLFGYIAAAIVVAIGLVIGLTSRFVFAGASMALIVVIIGSLAPALTFLSPDILATYVFTLLGYGMVYLLCENKFSHHTIKDKITTSRSIKHNPIFQRALVRKYQKSAQNGSSKT